MALLVRGDLPDAEVTEIEAHLVDCADCCALVAETSRLLQPASAEDTASPSVVLPPGATISRYKIEEALGAGGAGIVYRALDPELGRKVAIKVFPGAVGAGFASGSGSSSGGQHLREAKALARLAHPNVVNVHDVGTLPPDPPATDPRVYIVMELIDGQNVSQWLREQPRGWREIVDVFAQAGRGLAAAHAAQIIHRDVKPENVLIGPGGRARVADFGLAALEAAGAEAGEVLAGTPVYMAPERFRGKEADARSDQFSFCVALYASLYGRRPFEPSSENAGALPPSPPAEVPAAVHEVLRRGLSTNPEARFATMDELLVALAAAVDGARPRGWRRRPLVIVAGLSLAVAAAVLVRHRVAERRFRENLSCFDRLALGYSSTCAIARDRTAWCWGKVGWEHAGEASPTVDEEIRIVPLRMADSGRRPLVDVAQIFANYTTSCARTAPGALWCWGENSWAKGGDSGSGQMIRMAVAGRIDVGPSVTIAPGPLHTCALQENSILVCWGENQYGQLGTGERSDAIARAPRSVLNDRRDFVDVAAGLGFTCAIHADTSLSCWGDNTHGQLGLGASPSVSRPHSVKRSDGTNLTGVKAVSLGDQHSCALTGEGLFCWGSNDLGQLGSGSAKGANVPAPVVAGAGESGAPISGVVAVRTGSFHTCALKADGTVWCFGDNRYGELGRGTTGAVTLYPVQVVTAAGGPALTDVQEIMAGSLSSCARRRDGSIWCWGKNHGNQLGLGDTRDRNFAVTMQGPCR